MKTGRKAKYSCNENFFESIDSPEKAYFLGFVMADGHVGNRGLTIGLALKDYSILEKFCQALNCDVPIRTDPKRGACVLNITRINIVNDLRKLGLESDKSKNNLPWIQIDEKLMPDLIRGFFDGDGSIWNKGGSCWAMGFTGGFKFLSILKEYLGKLGISSNEIRHRHGKVNRNSCQLDISSSANISLFYETFYYKGCVCLDRKADKFVLFKKQSDLWKGTRFSENGNEEKILDLYKSGSTQKEISKILSLNYGSVRGTVQRARKKGLCV